MSDLTEQMVLDSLDSSIDGTYNSFINLGHGYFELANCRITVFKERYNWCLVFEKFGYNPRSATGVSVELLYFGNCLVNLDEVNGESSNIKFVEVPNNIQEAINKNNNSAFLNGVNIEFPLSKDEYLKLGIPLELGELYVGSVLRYVSEIYPEYTRVEESLIRQCIPSGMEKILVIDEWEHFEYSEYDRSKPPSSSSFFKMLAKVIVSGDTDNFKASSHPNTNWRNWKDSGRL